MRTAPAWAVRFAKTADRDRQLDRIRPRLQLRGALADRRYHPTGAIERSRILEWTFDHRKVLAGPQRDPARRVESVEILPSLQIGRIEFRKGLARHRCVEQPQRVPIVCRHNPINWR